MPTRCDSRSPVAEPHHLLTESGCSLGLPIGLRGVAQCLLQLSDGWLGGAHGAEWSSPSEGEKSGRQVSDVLVSLSRAERPLGLQGSQPGGRVPRPSLEGGGAEPGPAPSPPRSQGLGAAWLAASADTVFRRIPALGPLQPESRAIPSCPLGPRASVSARLLPASQPQTQRGQR